MYYLSVFWIRIESMDLLAKIVRGYCPSTIFVKKSILDVPLSLNTTLQIVKPLLTFSKSQAADLFAN